jgi:hypothetical protein
MQGNQHKTLWTALEFNLFAVANNDSE